MDREESLRAFLKAQEKGKARSIYVVAGLLLGALGFFGLAIRECPRVVWLVVAGVVAVFGVAFWLAT